MLSIITAHDAGFLMSVKGHEGVLPYVPWHKSHLYNEWAKNKTVINEPRELLSWLPSVDDMQVVRFFRDYGRELKLTRTMRAMFPVIPMGMWKQQIILHTTEFEVLRWRRSLT